jgi:GAF domain/PAS fold
MPYQELKRLEAVNRFLLIKIDKQEEFREIVRLAASICGTSMGLITLIGQDTEYILLDDGFAPNSGRNESFCHYVLESDTVMVVADAQLDARLKDYPAVTREAGIRFYAGAPITTHDGHRLGSLCVIDQSPLALTAVQKEMLQNLAEQVIQLLELESNLHYLKLQYLEAKKLELKMTSFFESTASSHLLLDKEFNVIAYNKATRDFIKMAYGVDMRVGMYVKEFVNEAYMADFIENCSRALAGENITRERLLNIGSHEVWCMLTYDPARNDKGDIIGISFNSRDITRQARQQQIAIEQQSKLDHIAYIQSHEFRRPVATIKGLIYLLEMDNYTQAHPLLQAIKEGINVVDDKISEIINFTIMPEKLPG